MIQGTEVDIRYFEKNNGYKNSLPTISRNNEEKRKEKENYENIAKDFEAMRKELFFRRRDVKWLNLIITTGLHLIAVYGYLTFTYLHKKKTVLWSIFLIILSNFGVTGGAHRYWSHQSFKATVPLKIILLLSYTMSGQYPIFWWVRDHRVHHKFTETEADPYNSLRGFWFSHIGWLVMKRHPDVMRKGRLLDLTEVYNNPWIQFELKYHKILTTLCCFIIPILIPMIFWNETLFDSIMSQVFMRYIFQLNCILSINSFAHMYGSRPYDMNIEARENKVVSFFANGEGWHNYHHTFPIDYKAAELGNYSLNLTAMFIDFFAKIGWAYDLKEPSKELIESVAVKRGDGSHEMKIGDENYNFKS